MGFKNFFQKFNDIQEKISVKLDPVRDYYEKNVDTVESIQAFAMESISSLYSVYNDVKYSDRAPGALDYISVGSDILSSYKGNIKHLFTRSRYGTSEWLAETDVVLVNLITFVLESSFGEQVKNKRLVLPFALDMKTNAKFIEIDGIEIVWCKLENNQKIIYFREKDRPNLENIVRANFWKLFDHPRIRFEFNAEKGDFQFTRDIYKEKFFLSKRAEELSKEIQIYKEKGENTSILIYGPPGTGKSNLVKSIGELSKLKTMRILDINVLQKRTTEIILDLIRPDCLVIEDIDRSRRTELERIFVGLENFSEKKIILLATANKVGKLDPAVIRPERFDQLIELKKLDDELVFSIVNKDPEIFEVVKEWPIVFINEVMKRIRIHGKEKVLSDKIDDLQDRLDSMDMDEYRLVSNQTFDDEDFMMMQDAVENLSQHETDRVARVAQTARQVIAMNKDIDPLPDDYEADYDDEEDYEND